MKIMKQLFAGIILFLVSCGSPEQSTPAATPEAIPLYFPSALMHWSEKISTCASSNPLIGLYFNPTLTADDEITKNGISLFLGEPDEINNSWYPSQIGWDTIQVIVNQENELSALTADEIEAIFSGQLTGWENGAGQPIQVWVLPIEDPVRANFDRAVLKSNRLTSDAMLAPDTNAMVEAIASNAHAIGYLTEGELSSGEPVFSSRVHVVEIESSLQQALRLPVIALTHGEPAGLVRELLVCAQASMP